MPRRVLFLIFLACAAGLAFGLGLQYARQVDPCPMCIVQRWALTFTGLVCGISAMFRKRGLLATGVILATVTAGFGAFTAARQSWLQWDPPPGYSCGRDIYGMIEAFPLWDALSMIYKGSGDCTQVDWSFLGLSLANWSFLVFSAFILIFLALLWRLLRMR